MRQPHSAMCVVLCAPRAHICGAILGRPGDLTRLRRVHICWPRYSFRMARVLSIESLRAQPHLEPIARCCQLPAYILRNTSYPLGQGSISRCPTSNQCTAADKTMPVGTSMSTRRLVSNRGRRLYAKPLNIEASDCAGLALPPECGEGLAGAPTAHR